MIIVMLKKISDIRPLLIVILPGLIATVLVLNSGIAPKKVIAAPSNCPDAIEGWYGCWQNLTTWKSQANLWCAFADSSGRGGVSKRDECTLALLSQLNLKPSGLNQPDACDNASTAFRTPGGCYATLKTGGFWRLALRDFSTECTFTKPDPPCSERLRTEFAEENNWAPNGSGSSSGSGAAINTNNEGAQSKFIGRISTYIKWFSLGIGILAVFGLVISGIQYAAAQDNPQAVAGAKTRIYNIAIGIVIYALMFGLLQWLIPGGLFSL